MARRTYNIPQQNLLGGVRSVSPDTASDGVAYDAQIRLVSSEWAAKAGTGDVTWGLDRSDDGGANFYAWVTVVSPIGALAKDGGLPIVGVAREDLIGAGGARLRLFAQPAVDLRLGATIILD